MTRAADPSMRDTGEAGSRGERRGRSLEIALDVLRIESSAIEEVANRFASDAVDRVLDLMLGCTGRIICTGMGKSGIIGKKLAGTLASTGSPSFFLHPAEAGHGDLGMVVDGDVVIAISTSGETAEVLSLLPRIRRLGVPLIALVGKSESTLAREADVSLDIGVEEEACPLGLAPTASTTAALAMGDALAMALLNERGFDADDFAAVHPRGRLGRELLRVRHAMHAGEEVPRVREDDDLASVVEEMSTKQLGMTSVVDDEGRLVGIITDGDLRRLIEREGVEPGCTAADCMTEGPICISSDELATEALRIMEERKITSLLVVGEDRLVEGVVHLHDLWRTELI